MQPLWGTEFWDLTTTESKRFFYSCIKSVGTLQRPWARELHFPYQSKGRNSDFCSRFKRGWYIIHLWAVKIPAKLVELHTRSGTIYPLSTRWRKGFVFHPADPAYLWGQGSGVGKLSFHLWLTCIIACGLLRQTVTLILFGQCINQVLLFLEFVFTLNNTKL